MDILAWVATKMKSESPHSSGTHCNPRTTFKRTVKRMYTGRRVVQVNFLGFKISGSWCTNLRVGFPIFSSLLKNQLQSLYNLKIGYFAGSKLFWLNSQKIFEVFVSALKFSDILQNYSHFQTTNMTFWHFAKSFIVFLVALYLKTAVRFTEHATRGCCMGIYRVMYWHKMPTLSALKNKNFLTPQHLLYGSSLHQPALCTNSILSCFNYTYKVKLLTRLHNRPTRRLQEAETRELGQKISDKHNHRNLQSLRLDIQEALGKAYLKYLQTFRISVYITTYLDHHLQCDVFIISITRQSTTL